MINVPTPSNSNVPRMILLISLPIPDILYEPADCIIIVLLYKDNFLPINIKNKVMIVINPKPPIWIRASITIWPNNVQCSKVSNGTKPVTHVALVAVKSASKKDVYPFLEASGNNSSIVPTIMVNIYPIDKNLTGDNTFFIFSTFYIIISFLLYNYPIIDLIIALYNSIIAHILTPFSHSESNI